MHRKGLGTLKDIYHAVYERDSGAWTVEIVEEPSCHSWGRTLAQAKENIRDALALWFNTGPSKVRVEDTFRFPPTIRKQLATLDHSRGDLRGAQSAFSLNALTAAEALKKELGLSLRDTAEIVGLSHQRVHQMLVENNKGRKRRALSK